MEKFVQEYLKDRSGNPIYDVIAGSSERNQRQYLLVKKGASTAVGTLYDEDRYVNMTKSWKFYPWVAYKPEEAGHHSFYRKPLVAELKVQECKLSIILVHIKPMHIGLNPTDEDYVKESVLARQKITSEIKKARDYLGDVLTEEMTRSIVDVLAPPRKGENGPRIPRTDGETQKTTGPNEIEERGTHITFSRDGLGSLILGCC